MIPILSSMFDGLYYIHAGLLLLQHCIDTTTSAGDRSYARRGRLHWQA